MMRQLDPYSTLGISRHADVAAVRAAYLARAKAWHPDRSAAADRFERFLALQQAYRLLRDPEWRARYDSEIAAAELREFRKIRRARRRLRKFDRGRRSRSGGRQFSWPTAMVFLTGGALAAGAYYLAMY